MSVKQYQLTVRKGPTVGEIFPLDLPIITIGRDPIADIVINDPEISRQHTRLTRTPTGFSIQDLGSTNGTFINGERIGGDPVELQPDQTISMGSGVTLLYEQIETTYEPETDDADPADAFFYVPDESNEPEEIIENVQNDEPVYSSDPVYTSPPQIPIETPPTNNRRNIIIIVSILLILCCCCSFLAFMWFYGGDWMLEQMGLLP